MKPENTDVSRHLENNELWDMVLLPKAGLFDINISEIWHYRDLLVLFVKRDFVAQFKQTILGPVWHFVQPIFTTIIFLMVFGSSSAINSFAFSINLVSKYFIYNILVKASQS